MRMPALAVVGADHKIIRSTETFRLKCENSVALCETSPELDLVLTGQTDNAVLDVGGLSLAIEAVTDAAGKRQAMLSLRAEDLGSKPEALLLELREAADESPAIVWAKDLEGRYLYANARHERDLEISDEQLLGNTDADLPPAQTVDGPRLRYTGDGLKEPLQLEYNVPAIDSRPPMVAFRFPLRNEQGHPVGTCGVAAPSGEAQVARDEAVRLMQLERWNRLDPLDMRAELLEQWHVRTTPGPVTGADPAPAEKARGGRVRLFPRRAPAEDPAADLQAVTAEPGDVIADVEPAPRADLPAVAPEPPQPAIADGSDLAASAPVEPEQRDQQPAAAAPPYSREDEWVRQLRQSGGITVADAGSATADALQSDLRLARTWAERADQLQGDLQAAHARLLEAEAETQHAQAEAEKAVASARLAAEESARLRDESDRLREELEQNREQLAREQSESLAARHEVEAAQRELEGARAQADSLRGPADAASRLSEELERALAAEQERGEELANTLTRIQARLADLDGAAEQTRLVTPSPL